MNCVIIFATALLILLWDFLGYFRLATPDYTAFWTAVTAVATIALCIIARFQIRALESQQQGWETLRICNQFDLDPTILETRKRLTRANSGFPDKDVPTEFDLRTLLNFFDAIAIGIEQGFYKDTIVKAHLGRMMHDYRCNQLSDEFAGKNGISDLNDGYSSYLDKLEKWDLEDGGRT